VSLLGQNAAIPGQYAPEVLDGIPRQLGRDSLGLEAALPFFGEDVWHAWELAWLDQQACAQVGVARLSFAASSPRLVESKSLKLYLNSLNQHRFACAADLQTTLIADLSAVAGTDVQVEVLSLDSPLLMPTTMHGECIDSWPRGVSVGEPDAGVLKSEAGQGEQVLYSHLLRSLCPITAQPDWATVIVRCSGRQLVPSSLLDYINGFREHQEFHEQCVERMYRDILQACEPEKLSVQALYTRRGGLDINPFRSSEAHAAPRLRSLRQ
jgi:7-cyano-7-deazaguanine reductase